MSSVEKYGRKGKMMGERGGGPLVVGIVLLIAFLSGFSVFVQFSCGFLILKITCRLRYKCENISGFSVCNPFSIGFSVSFLRKVLFVFYASDNSKTIPRNSKHRIHWWLSRYQS